MAMSGIIAPGPSDPKKNAPKYEPAKATEPIKAPELKSFDTVEGRMANSQKPNAQYDAPKPETLLPYQAEATLDTVGPETKQIIKLLRCEDGWIPLTTGKEAAEVVKGVQRLLLSRSIETLDKIYAKRYLVVPTPGISNFIVDANEIKAHKAELIKQRDGLK